MAAIELLLGAAALAAPLGLAASAGLRYAVTRQQRAETLVDHIDALLPQTQCGQCGHPGCRPYAEAITRGEPFNRCPPGREHTVIALAELLHEQPLPLDIDGPAKPRAIAFIREAECIGCTKCIQACPVDAILGATKLMHTVIADECTGCDLCVEPCPVDCIDLLPLPDDRQQITLAEAEHFRTRFHAHNARLQRDHAEQEQRRAQRKSAAAAKDVFAPFAAPAISETTSTSVTTASSVARVESSAAIAPPHEEATTDNTATDKQAQIQAAIARAKAKKASVASPAPDTPVLSAKQTEIQAAIARTKAKKAAATSPQPDATASSAKQTEIQAAIARAKAKRAAPQAGNEPEPKP